MHLRKRVAATVFALAVVAALTVVWGASARPDAPRETVTLRGLWSTSSQAAQEIINANFMRVYPNIHIEAQYLPSTAADTLVLTQLQAGTGPDFIRVHAGQEIAGVWQLAEAGRLLDLTGRPWNKRLLPSAKANYSWHGKVYAWHEGVTPFGVDFNVELFKQLGLTVPTTFAQVLAMCRKITAAGKIPIVSASGNTTTWSILLAQRASQYVYSVDPTWTAKRTRKQVTFSSSPLWRRALQSIVDMKDAGCFQPASQGMVNRAGMWPVFASGGALMTIVSGSENSNITAINPSLKFQMFNLPADVAKNSRVHLPAAIGIGVNAATKYPAEAKLFVDFEAREQQSRLFAKVSGALAPLDVKKGLIPEYAKPLAPLLLAGKYVESAKSTWPNPVVFQNAQAGVIGLFTGQTTIDSILQNMDKDWDTP